MDLIPSGSVPSPPSQPEFTLTGFNHRRVYPKLPPGYEWKTQIKKYCPRNLPTRLQENLRSHGYVFCHRGLYERAMKIPENSILAVENGLEHGLVLHEIDVRISRDPREAFVAHDETAKRVTANDERWSAVSSKRRQKMPLVSKGFDDDKMDFASTYDLSEEMVPQLAALLGVDWKDPFSSSNRMDQAYQFGYLIFPPKEMYPPGGRCFQLDLRAGDLAKAIAFFQMNDTILYKNRMILKGYNLEYASGQELQEAVHREARKQGNEHDLRGFGTGPSIIMVFYWKAVVPDTLQSKGWTTKDLARLKAKDIYDEVMKQALSYIEVCKRDIIFEIVCTGLGLGYNLKTGMAVNPLDGTPITNPQVIFESRVDRGMIAASLGLRHKYLELHLSSCTRLCDVRTSTQEWIANMVTGVPELKPSGDKGISSRLRGVHGGLFPQSDLVIADDPLAEIAATTWIDEHAKLDRSQLLTLSYDKWLAQAGAEVVEAVNELNGPFWPNTWEGPLSIVSDDPESMIRDSKKAGLAPRTKCAPMTVTSSVTARPSKPSSHDKQGSKSLLQHGLRVNEEPTRGTP